MSGECLQWSDIYLKLCLSRSISSGETADCGYGTKGQWSSGHRSCFARQSQYSYSGIKKKESQLQQVNLKVLKQLSPQQVEVEIRLTGLPEEPDGIESQQWRDVELRWQEV